MKFVDIEVELDDELQAQAEILANERNLTVADIIEEAVLRQFIKEGLIKEDEYEKHKYKR